MGDYKNMVVEKDIKIINKLGFHARAAANFVKTAENFSSKISVSKDGIYADGKSILGLLTLGASKGTVITVKVNGDDSEKALKALEDLINNKFGEEE